MASRYRTKDDPQVAAAVDELESLIRRRYPEATFEVFCRDDPAGIRLRATVAHVDSDDVLDTVIDRLYQLQVEDGLPIYVIPVRPLPAVVEKAGSGFAPGAASLPRPPLDR